MNPDKARILQYINGELITALLKFNQQVKIDLGKKPKKGDVVYCVTSSFQNHDWVISIFEGYKSENGGAWGSSEFILREIGSNRICNMSNESLYVIDGLDPIRMLEGDKHQLYLKIRKTFSRHGDEWHLFGGIDFNDEKQEVTITVRERYGGFMPKTIDGKDFVSTPYQITLQVPKWGKRLSMKKIAVAMQEQGWLKKDFPLIPKPIDTPKGNITIVSFAQ